jgi:hypothetical protein
VGGSLAVGASLLAAFAKIRALAILSGVRPFEGLRSFMAPALSCIYLLQLVFVLFLKSFEIYREISTFAVWALVGMVLVTLAHTRPPAHREDAAASPKWLGSSRSSIGHWPCPPPEARRRPAIF